MRAKVSGCVLALALGAAGGGVALPVDSLERVLADWRLGCAECVVRYSWSEQELATFVAGRLASLGFPSALALSGEAWWVLATVDEEGGEGCVPVLPGLPPADREGQFARGVFLGRIPRTATGEVDRSYLAPEQVVPLPPNVPPSLRVRVHPNPPQAGETVWFIVEATDPDGTLVQAWWDFGDGAYPACAYSAWWNPDHAYTHEGVYTVTLTVVDDRGAVTTTVVMVEVVAPTPMPPGGGCGCGR